MFRQAPATIWPYGSCPPPTPWGCSHTLVLWAYLFPGLLLGRAGARGGGDWRGKRRFHVPVITLKVISVAVTFLL